MKNINKIEFYSRLEPAKMCSNCVYYKCSKGSSYCTLSGFELENGMYYCTEWKIYRLSRMLITENNKIFLTDYDNLEIKMEPLIKSVYFLFLKHPEGILKDSFDYKKELEYQYKHMYIQIEWKQKSIDNIVDPTHISMATQLSYIKTIFCKFLGNTIAQNYYILGKRAGRYTIPLNRELITWQ